MRSPEVSINERDPEYLSEGEMIEIVRNLNKDAKEERVTIEDDRFVIDNGAVKVRPMRTYVNEITGKEAPIEEFLKGLLDR